MTQEQSKPNQTPKAKSKPKAPKAKARKARSNGTSWKVIRGVMVYAGIPMLFLVCLYIGLYIGYVKLGKQPAGDIWNLETWRHMYDLVFAER